MLFLFCLEKHLWFEWFYQAIQGIFSKPIFEAPTGFDDPTPIFIVGLPRSGSTLVEQLLASHSEVLAIGEDTPFAPIVGELMDALSEQGVNHQKVGWHLLCNIQLLLLYLIVNPCSSTCFLISEFCQVLKDAGAKAVFAMRALAPSDFPSPARIVDKMLRNVWNVGYMHLILPKACIIHAARHPLDAGLSCYAQPFEGRGTRWAWDLVGTKKQLSHGSSMAALSASICLKSVACLQILATSIRFFTVSSSIGIVSFRRGFWGFTMSCLCRISKRRQGELSDIVAWNGKTAYCSSTRPSDQCRLQVWSRYLTDFSLTSSTLSYYTLSSIRNVVHRFGESYIRLQLGDGSNSRIFWALWRMS